MQEQEKFAVYINGDEFLLEKKDKLNKNTTTSGTCYHLRDGDLDLAVKIYHKEDPMDGEYPWFPEEDMLQKFIQLAPYTFPVLLSQYFVRDIQGDYIGCARECIYPSYKNTVDAIFKLPKEQVFPYFQSIQDTIYLFDQASIVLDDWNSYNVMLGKTMTLPTSLFVFDDSSYSVSDNDKVNNQFEFDHLIEDLTENYLENISLSNATHYIVEDMRRSRTHLQFLQDITDKRDSIGEGVSQYAKNINKKYF